MALAEDICSFFAALIHHRQQGLSTSVSAKAAMEEADILSGAVTY